MKPITLIVALIFSLGEIFANEHELASIYVRDLGWGDVEVLKFYNDDKVEHFFYEKGYDFLKVHKNLYQKVSSKRTSRLEILTQEFESEITNCRLREDNGIYVSWKSWYFKKENALYQLADSSLQSRPFYLHPDENIVVDNISDSLIDLEGLLGYLLKDCISEKDKALCLSHFICDNISYDRTYLQSGVHANDQNDLMAILFGENRTAVCEGYSKVFKSLCDQVGIKCEYVVGYTRSSCSDISMFTGYHAWNVLELENERFIFDVTWADGGDDHWLMTDPELMIYSHFPDNPEYQLLDEPISKEQFKNQCAIVPFAQTEMIPVNLTRGTLLCPDKTLKLAFEGNVNVKVYRVSGAIFNISYEGEVSSNKSSYDYIPVKNVWTKHKGDSTFVTIKFGKYVAGLNVEVENAFNMYYKLISQTKREYYEDLATKCTNKRIQSLGMGFCAAVSLEDLGSLNRIAPELNITEENISFYKIQLGEWDGTIGSLTKVYSTFIGFFANIDGSEDKEDSESFHYELPINDNFTLKLDKENDKWVIKEVEI